MSRHWVQIGLRGCMPLPLFANDLVLVAHGPNPNATVWLGRSLWRKSGFALAKGFAYLRRRPSASSFKDRIWGHGRRVQIV